MARILSFSTAARREASAVLPLPASGEVVGMRHIDLETVVRTVRFMREAGRGHLLDSFNRGTDVAPPKRVRGAARKSQS